MKNTIEVTKTLPIHPSQMGGYVQHLASSLQSELGIVWKWTSPTLIEFQTPSGVAKGTSGTLAFQGSTAFLRVHLPFMLAAMSPLIEAKIDERLRAVEALAASAPAGKVPA